jgi:hypothetical protein
MLFVQRGSTAELSRFPFYTLPLTVPRITYPYCLRHAPKQTMHQKVLATMLLPKLQNSSTVRESKGKIWLYSVSGNRTASESRPEDRPIVEDSGHKHSFFFVLAGR